MNYAAVDFESYWDSDEEDPCSVSVLGTDSYILHKRWECYQVAIVTSTGLEWVGDPAYAPWDKISGSEWEWLGHNASFDERVHYHLRQRGTVPDIGPRLWHCTSDLCAFSAAPRALKKAAAYLYGEKVSKDYRDKTKGVRFAVLSPEKQAEVRAAGLVDARCALRFWNDLSPKWSETERRISRLSRQQSWRGLRMDVPRIEKGIQHLKLICWAAENMLPWAGDCNTPLAYAKLCEECRKEGIDAPPEINKVSEACAAWEEKYSARFKWVDAMRQLRSANGFLKKLETMRARILPNGRMGYQNKYFGAHTGRWGDGDEGNRSSERNKGFNSRNLPQKEKFGEEWLLGKLKKDGTREEADGKNFQHLFPGGKIEGVNLRYCIIPEEGCQFVIPDLRQIEPRVLWHFAGDKAALDLVRQGMSPYEAHGRMTMGYDKPEPMEEGDPDGYRLGKARILALGYQAAWEKFIQMAPTYISEEDCLRIFSAEVTPDQTQAFEKYVNKYGSAIQKAKWKAGDERYRVTCVNSWLIVMGFRRDNPLIAGNGYYGNPEGLWKRLDKALKSAIGEDLEIVLPSGRSLSYKKIAVVEGQTTGIVIRNGNPCRINLYGGKLLENLCQAVARDIFVECILRLDDAGYWVALHSHDEAACEVLLSVEPKEIQNIMAQPPSWMPDLPVQSSCKTALHYTK